MYKFSIAEPQPEITSKVGRWMKQFHNDDIKLDWRDWEGDKMMWEKADCDLQSSNSVSFSIHWNTK